MNRIKKIRGKSFLKILFSILLLCLAGCLIVQAHPMPNTDISVRLDESKVTLEIKIPVPEFVLGFPKSEGVTTENLLVESCEKVEAYFRLHLQILSRSGVAQDYSITSLSVDGNTDEFVGDYQELIAEFAVPVRDDFNPRDFFLAYDAVINQVPNHFAIVKITQDFNNGVFAEDKAMTVGVIRYDFSNNSVPPLSINSTSGGIFKGFRAMVALGMRHIWVGLDHVLFLLTLLIVAPLAVKNGKWTLFQGFGYTLRRFLTVSFAFTVGHSAALAFGAFDALPVNQKLIEVLIATSVLLTALHAIRPFFSRREALIALCFGIIHGLAFSESLKSLRLSPLQKAISMLGFNVGIELMQIILMAVVFPVLLVSRYKIYDWLRIIFTSIASVTACVWIIERITGSTILNIFD